MEARVKLYQNNLISSGMAVIAFGLWSIARTLLYFYMERANLLDRIEETLSGDAEYIAQETVYWFMFFIVLVVMLVDLLLRFYVGRSAIREGRGEGYRRGRLYLVVAVLYTADSLRRDLSAVLDRSPEEILNVLPDVIIDLTSCMAFLIILVSAVMLRRLPGVQRTAPDKRR